MARYSLANYTLSIKLDSNFAELVGLGDQQVLVIGGEGSYLQSITVELDNDMYTTKSDATGSWVHDVNLSRTGKVTISINQMSDKIAKFKNIVNLFVQNPDYEGLDLELKGNNDTISILECEDCYFQKIPSQEFGQEAGDQSWILTCGRITFHE